MDAREVNTQSASERFPMTTKTTKPIDVADARDAGEEPAKFPDFPPRDDVQNTNYIYSQSTITALMNYLGNPDTTYVGSETPLAWTASVRKGVLIPDLMVARNCDAARLDAQDGYEMRSQPGPPEFVLKVASRFTRRSGIIPPRGLEGDRLICGAYEPI